jgi:hypothetical protein
MAICPFPEFAESGLRDYMGRTPQESLEAIRIITGLPLPIMKGKATGKVLGRRFWEAMVRGGYQGAAYYIDTLGEVDEK